MFHIWKDESLAVALGWRTSPLNCSLCSASALLIIAGFSLLHGGALHSSVLVSVEKKRVYDDSVLFAIHLWRWSSYNVLLFHGKFYKNIFALFGWTYIQTLSYKHDTFNSLIALARWSPCNSVQCSCCKFQSQLSHHHTSAPGQQRQTATLDCQQRSECCRPQTRHCSSCTEFIKVLLNMWLSATEINGSATYIANLSPASLSFCISLVGVADHWNNHLILIPLVQADMILPKVSYKGRAVVWHSESPIFNITAIDLKKIHSENNW